MPGMSQPLPEHYRRTLRRLVRFALVGIGVGLCLGIVWTEFRRSLRYGPVAKQVEKVEGSRVRLELPPGMMFETGLDLKIGHGHVTLVAGLLPLCLGLALYLTHVCGGSEIKASTLDWFFWLYVPGAVGALLLMLYKGLVGFLAVRGGQFDLGQVDAQLFGGSRALRGACYGITHTILAVGAFILIVAVFKAIGRGSEPAAPAAEA